MYTQQPSKETTGYFLWPKDIVNREHLTVSWLIQFLSYIYFRRKQWLNLNPLWITVKLAFVFSLDSAAGGEFPKEVRYFRENQTFEWAKVVSSFFERNARQFENKDCVFSRELKNYKEKMKETIQRLKTSRQEVMEKYEIYRDSVDRLPSCQLEVQLYQKKIQDLADNRGKLTNILKEVSMV